MSSYFDEKSRLYRRAETPEGKREVVETVVKDVGAYLEYISANCRSAFRIRLVPLEIKFREVSGHPRDDEMAFMVIEDLHDLCHDIGRARIGIRRRGFASDNPDRRR